MRVITGQVVDIFQKRIYPAVITFHDRKIVKIEPVIAAGGGHTGISPAYILPGFIDAHVHIESSMLVPSEFARLAVVHGTVATVSDPHEIANVCGVEGVDFMIKNGNSVPFKFNFGAPSCVPATSFETAGASLDAQQVAALLERPEIKYLSEMMDFPGVLSGKEQVMKKIEAAGKCNKPVDGHAPGLVGEKARAYINAGISTDHECFTKEEALEKILAGMTVIIREGSAARNFETLIELLHQYPDKIMFCSDDKHPDSLVDGHINTLCERAVKKGINVFDVLKAACINPALHYKLDVGLLREGDAADFIVVEDLQSFRVLQTYIDGELVATEGRSLINVQQPDTTAVETQVINNFNCSKKEVSDFVLPGSTITRADLIPVIEALEGQLITNRLLCAPTSFEDNIVSDPDRDMLKIAVINRYNDAPVAMAFVKNFGLKSGAIASSVAHDSHNIVAIGVDDVSLCMAVNNVIGHRGGISCVGPLTDNDIGLKDPAGYSMVTLPLPVAGLMSAENGYQVAQNYISIDAMAKALGCSLAAPFMTLSFMALLVIPHLKLSDKGLFDGDEFRLINW